MMVCLLSQITLTCAARYTLKRKEASEKSFLVERGGEISWEKKREERPSLPPKLLLLLL